MSKQAAKEAKLKRMDFWERNRLSEGYLLKKTITKYAVIILRFLLMFGLVFLILQPILNKVSVSFMEEKDLYDSTINSIPKNFTTENYRLAGQLMDYWKTLKNTMLVSLFVAIVQISACTLVGYGFARYEFPLKKFWFACVIMVIVIPPQTISTSLYLHFRFFDVFGIVEAIKGEGINLRGSMLPYFLMSAGCMGLKNGLYIYLIRQFFRGIPKELEEGAYVDGCGHFRTFFSIMLPDAKPILTSCFLFSFVWQWTDSFYSRMFLGKVNLLARKLNSLGDALNKYYELLSTGSRGATEGYMQCIISTGVLMTIVPILILYVFAQRGFVESLSQTGIKM